MKKWLLCAFLFLVSLITLGQQTQGNTCHDRIISKIITVPPGISPNPAFDYIGFNLDVSVMVSVYNQQGIEVIPVTEIEPDELLEIAHLPEGIYMVKMNTGEETITWQFVKS
jgi:hypothetical protein